MTKCEKHLFDNIEQEYVSIKLELTFSLLEVLAGRILFTRCPVSVSKIHNN